MILDQEIGTEIIPIKIDSTLETGLTQETDSTLETDIILQIDSTQETDTTPEPVTTDQTGDHQID